MCIRLLDRIGPGQWSADIRQQPAARSAPGYWLLIDGSHANATDASASVLDLAPTS